MKHTLTLLTAQLLAFWLLPVPLSLAQDADGLANYNKHPLVLSKRTHDLAISSDDGVAFTLTATGDDPYVFF